MDRVQNLLLSVNSIRMVGDDTARMGEGHTNLFGKFKISDDIAM